MLSHITTSVVIDFKFQLSFPVRSNQPKLRDKPSLLVLLIADHSATTVDVCFHWNWLARRLVTPQKPAQY